MYSWRIGFLEKFVGLKYVFAGLCVNDCKKLDFYMKKKFNYISSRQLVDKFYVETRFQRECLADELKSKVFQFIIGDSYK